MAYWPPKLGYSKALLLKAWLFESLATGCRGDNDMTTLRICTVLRFCIALQAVSFIAPAHAEKRVALVIGNNDYRNVPPLRCPRDAHRHRYDGA